MHKGMPYDPIQGQGNRAFEVLEIALFQVYLLRQCKRANDHRLLYYSTTSKFDPARFFFTFVPLFVSRDLELGGVPAVSSSTKKFFRFQ